MYMQECMGVWLVEESRPIRITFFPGKLYVVTIQIVTVPTANTIDATPSTKIKDDFT